MHYTVIPSRVLSNSSVGLPVYLCRLEWIGVFPLCRFSLAVQKDYQDSVFRYFHYTSSQMLKKAFA